MKNIAITCLVLVAVCVGLQAKKTVKAPYFMAASSNQLEIEKVTLGKDTTWVDAKIYTISGDDVLMNVMPYFSIKSMQLLGLNVLIITRHAPA